ncbi:MAG: inositol monophosphatase family protein [Alphaproteobacteria bacterium]|nr:inositol monophosphatase family protein [Alphaproteobacteria bacterium]
MTTASWDREAELAVHAVTTAARLLGDRPDPAAVATKESKRDVVTAVDTRIERHIAQQLEPLGHALLGEETAPDHTFDGRPTWVVDPIDGTANWLAGLDWFAISLALRVGDAWPVGVVLLPARSELYFAWRGGAYFAGRHLRPPADLPLGASLLAVSFSGAARDPARRATEFAAFGALNDASRGALRLGSTAANVAAVTRGSLGVAYGFDAGLWDVAGGLAVAQALGLSTRLVHRPANRCDFVIGTPDAAADVHRRLVDLGLWEDA